MSIKLFHQCGHNTNWNKESFLDDDCGDGLILSPVHQNKSNIENMSSDIKNVSFFDPQYYLPSSQKKKLKTYEFFPESISNGFATVDFTMHSLESAKQCLDFQIEQGFERLVIPARHFSEMEPDYTIKQDVYTVHPFLKAIDDIGTDKKIFLTVPLTAAMLTHEGYRTNILNWVTSYPRIDGVYLLVEDSRATKQIQDASYLKQYLKAVKELSDAGLVVTVGHTNTEGLLFSLIEDCEISFGAYENTRIFSVDKFVVSDEERRGPKARMYLPGLFNWIHFSHAKQIKEELPGVWGKIYSETSYAEDVLAAAAEPYFNQPALYKHYFMAFQEQIDELSDLSITDRYHWLRNNLLEAEKLYDEISRWPLDLDRHGKGEHINPWLDAINWYFREYLS